MGETEASAAEAKCMVTNRARQQIDDAIKSIVDLRKQNGKITIEELRSARDDGRRH